MFFVALPTPERNKGGRHRSSRLRRRIITGMPYVNKRMNVIFLPAFSDIPTTITFAERRSPNRFRRGRPPSISTAPASVTTVFWIFSRMFGGEARPEQVADRARGAPSRRFAALSGLGSRRRRSQPDRRCVSGS
jgi:hypothetical protein